MAPLLLVLHIRKKAVDAEGRYSCHSRTFVVAETVLQLPNLGLRNRSNFVDDVAAEQALVRLGVVLKKVSTMNEDSAASVFRAFSSIRLKTTDQKVGSGQEQPQGDQCPSKGPDILQLFELWPVFEEDIVGFEHILLELVGTGFPGLCFFLEAVEQTLLRLRGPQRCLFVSGSLTNSEGLSMPGIDFFVKHVLQIHPAVLRIINIDAAFAGQLAKSATSISTSKQLCQMDIAQTTTSYR